MNSRRAWKAALLVAPVAATLAIAGPSAQGAAAASAVTDAPVDVATRDLPDVAAPKVGDPISDAEMRDLETVAEQSGASLDEVIERYAWNDNFALAVDQLRKAAPADFAGSAIVDARHAWIAFKGDQPEAMRTLATTFDSVPGNVIVDIQTNVGFSEREIDAAVAAAHFAALNSPGVGDATTSFDYDTRQITTTVIPSTKGANLDAAALDSVASRAAREAVADGDLGGVAIKIRVTDSATLGAADSHYGGELLSGGSCTSGFTVRTTGATSGSRGIATAGHCPNSLSDDGAALTFKGDYQGTYGDFQWHTGPQAIADDFYAGSTSTTETDLRDVSSMVNVPSVGQSLCTTGATNHKTCQQVRNTSVCNGSKCSLVEMGSRDRAPGDSGGPVYWGNAAYGFHEGYVWDPFQPFDRDVYSRADLIDNALGVYVALS